MKTLILTLAVALVAVGSSRPAAQQPPAVSSTITLKPTDHPPLPSDPALVRMTPGRAQTTRTAALNAFAAAVKLEADGNFAKALPTLSQPLLRDHALDEYVLCYKGLAELSVNRTADALRTFQALAASAPAG